MASFTLVAAMSVLNIACAADEPEITPVSEAGSTQLLLAPPTHHTVGVVREPALVEHPSGTLFVSGYGSQTADQSHPLQVPQLYKSTDEGASWDPVNLGTAEDGAIGNSDVDLAVGPNGTLYFATMGFSRTTFKGTHIAMGVSHDIGESWQWTLLSETEFDDRPWVAITPDATAHAVWNDGAGVSYARSEDRGVTWQEQPRIHPAGGSSHLATGPNGELAVRISPMSASANRYDEGVDLIVTSSDGGASWQQRPLPGAPRWPTKPEEFSVYQRWVEPLAFDTNGALFHFWGEGTTAFLARSKDLGATWERWTITEAQERVFFPFLAVSSGTPSVLAASWFENSGDALVARVARIAMPAAGPPSAQLSEPLKLDLFAQRMNGEEMVSVRDTGGEYFPIAVLTDGSVVAVTPLLLDETAGFTWLRSAPAN